MDAWYAVYTRPREEAIAQENLERQGFATYWPRYRKRASHARRIEEVAAGLFPRYLFARLDLSQSGWRTIRSTRGVVGLVTQGAEPASVSARLLDGIRAREDEQGFVVLGRQIELKKGQRVQLASDAFKGHDLIFEARKDSERVVVLLGLLGRQFEVAVPVREVMPVA